MKTTQDERFALAGCLAANTVELKVYEPMGLPTGLLSRLLADADRLARLEGGLRNIPRKRVYTDWGDGGGNGGAVLWRDIESLLED